VDNIKIDLREVGWDGVDWIDLAQDRDQWRALVNYIELLCKYYSARTDKNYEERQLQRLTLVRIGSKFLYNTVICITADNVRPYQGTATIF
jgi:hypothetical protein